MTIGLNIWTIFIWNGICNRICFVGVGSGHLILCQISRDLIVTIG